MAIDGIIFTGVDPLVFIYMYRSSHFHHVVIAPVMTDHSPKRLIMLQIATPFVFLVLPQNFKVDWSFPTISFFVSSPAELASMLLLSVVGLPCVRVSFVLSLFSFTPNAVYVHSPVIPCTYLLLVSDEAFTVLFVQFVLSTVRLLNHVLFRCLFGPDLPDGSRLCCSLAHECPRSPLLSLDSSSTSTPCKLQWLHLLLHLQPLFLLSVCLCSLFQ